MSGALLEARGLTKSYDGGRIQALRGVSLSIAPGEYVTIGGPSGSGKSTLLQLLGGLDTPSSGAILFESAPLGARMSLDAYRLTRVGFIFQSFHLLPTLRAVENVQVAMLANGWSAKRRAERAAALLREMDLEERMRHYPAQLSVGERQRVAIARALANDPALLLADEPTGNLDSVNSAHVMEILKGIQRRRGMALVVVTHDAEIARSAPRHIRIRDGTIEP
jgi:ABC-type lipoprotein export system ATPase subunit